MLLNSSTTPASRSVLILLGRRDGMFLTGFDHQLDTLMLDPQAVAIGDFMGASDGFLDLLVVARDDDDGYILAYQGDGTGNFAPALQRPLSFIPDGGSVDEPVPVFAALVRVRGVAPLDAVVGDLDALAFVAPDEWTTAGLAGAGGNTIDIPRPGGPDWVNANDAIAARSATDDRQDLVVVDNSDVIWLRNDDTTTGGFTNPLVFSNVFTTNNVARTTRLFDDNADGLPELATIFTEFETQVGYTGGTEADPEFTMRQLGPPFDFADDENNDVWLGSLGAGSGDELVVLDDAVVDPTSIHIAGDLVPNGSAITPETGLNDAEEFSAPAPRRIAVGDFDGDGTREIRTFDPTLDIDNTRCFHAVELGTGQFDFTDCP